MTGLSRIATSSMATLEPVSPPYNLRSGVRSENLNRGLEILDAAGSQHADLVCLPEMFTLAGIAGPARQEDVELLDGETVSRMSDLAKRHRMYVVGGVLCEVGGSPENLAVMLDRSGDVVASYAKMHLTPGELEAGIRPGREITVVETDLGRIGFAVCFDINWPDLWADLKSQGANLVCWPSAYGGGFPLRAYSWLHHYTVLSSVLSYNARVIDPLARVLARTSRWARLAYCDVDLQMSIFHTDGQAERILQTQRAYGDQVEVDALGEEHLFSVSVRVDSVSGDDISRRMGLVSLSNYLEACEKASLG